jgi:hypothetical protein
VCRGDGGSKTDWGDVGRQRSALEGRGVVAVKEARAVSCT